MFRAIGFVIVLTVLVHFFNHAFVAFERAAVETFETIEVAATISQEQLRSIELK